MTLLGNMKEGHRRAGVCLGWLENSPWARLCWSSGNVPEQLKGVRSRIVKPVPLRHLLVVEAQLNFPFSPSSGTLVHSVKWLTEFQNKWIFSFYLKTKINILFAWQITMYAFKAYVFLPGFTAYKSQHLRDLCTYMLLYDFLFTSGSCSLCLDLGFSEWEGNGWTPMEGHWPLFYWTQSAFVTHLFYGWEQGADFPEIFLGLFCKYLLWKYEMPKIIIWSPGTCSYTSLQVPSHLISAVSKCCLSLF